MLNKLRIKCVHAEISQKILISYVTSNQDFSYWKTINIQHEIRKDA
jgi:hypothetical protein